MNESGSRLLRACAELARASYAEGLYPDQADAMRSVAADARDELDRMAARLKRAEAALQAFAEWHSHADTFCRSNAKAHQKMSWAMQMWRREAAHE